MIFWSSSSSWYETSASRAMDYCLRWLIVRLEYHSLKEPAAEGIGDATRLIAALHLDRQADLDLHAAARNRFRGHDLAAAANPRAGPNCGRETDPIAAVVDAHCRAANLEKLGQEQAHER